MKVKYIGEDLVAIEHGKVYDVISIEKGWYRIITEIGEDYLFPPELFEIEPVISKRYDNEREKRKQNKE